MLQRLFIQNYAIIERQDIVFGEGLNIITGETGAGKSILLGALALVLGQRADTKVLYDTSQKAIVEATFIQYPAHLKTLLKEMELDVEPQIILRREILPSGKSRAFINDTPVRLDQMQRLTADLIDLHQQFESLEIQEASMQYRILDAFAEIHDDLSLYKSVFEEYKALGVRIERMQSEQARALQEKDYLQFQLEEFEALDLQPGQLEEMEAEFRLQENAEQIRQGMATGTDILTDGNYAVVVQIRQLLQELRPFARDDKTIKQITERLDAMQIEAEDLSGEMLTLAERIEPDPQRKQEMESIIDRIRRLMMKHDAHDEETLIDTRNAINEKLSAWEAVDEQLVQAQKQHTALAEKVGKLAAVLSEQRQAAAPPLSHEVTAMLQDLEMKNARLNVNVIPGREPGPLGSDEVEFLFASNLGSTEQPVRKVASGGELSRLSLCVKSAVSQKMQLPSLVFDEIDTGVSGQVALKMGHLLKELSGNHQIVMITHSPQIASRANHHLRVSKRDKAERSIAEVHMLNTDDRVREIATMLSGDPPTDAAVMNAKELINV